MSVRDFYDKKFGEVKFGELAGRLPEAYDLFLNLLSKKKGRLLDVGCGPDASLVRQAIGRGFRGYGCDFSREAIVRAQKNVGEGFFVERAAEDLSFWSGCFDVVMCIGSLEHTDVIQSLHEMWRVGKKNCEYVVVVPNRKYVVWGMKQWLFGRKLGTEQPKELLLDLDGWKSLFGFCGFDIVSVSQDVYPLRHSKYWWFNKLSWLIPLRWTYQFVFKLKKKVGGNNEI